MKKYFGLLLVCVVGFISLVPLFFPGLPITHDGQDHVARIANFYASLIEGNIVPRWAGNLNWGYGHPILMFLYPFPSYFASLFHFVGFSLIDSLKIVFGLTYILSGLGMYLWIKEIWGEKAAIASSVVYMYAPYRFVDLYVRGAIGEHVAFLFIPFIFLFLLKLSQKYNYFFFVGLSLSICGLILSHNAMAIMFLPLIVLYTYTLLKSKNKYFLTSAFFAITFGLGLSFFFLYPAFFEGKYTLRDKVTGSYEYRNSFVPFYKFFDLNWSFGGSVFLSKQIGIPIIFSFVVMTFLMLKKKGNKSLFVIFAGSIILSIFLMMQISDFIWSNISLIQKFQFPWRFLSVIVFSGSVLAGMLIGSINSQRNKKMLLMLIILLSIFFSLHYIKVNGYSQEPEIFYTDIYNGTTDTGESAPIWSVRFMEHQAKQPVEIIEGEAEVLNYSKSTTVRKYDIDAKSNSRVRENTLYFPNWEVYVNNRKVNIEYQDELNRGLITYFVPKGKSKILVIFNDTKQRILANSISILSGILIVFYIFLPKRFKRYDS